MEDLESRFSKIRDTVAQLVELSSQLQPIRDQYACASTRATNRANTRSPGYESVERFVVYAVELAKTLPELQVVLDEFQADLEALKNDSALNGTSAEVNPAIDKASSMVACGLTPGSEAEEAEGSSTIEVEVMDKPLISLDRVAAEENPNSPCQAASNDTGSSEADERTGDTADVSNETETEHATADDTSQATTEATTPGGTPREIDEDGARFVLDRANMGDKLVPTLATFISDPTFRNQVTVKGPTLDITNHGIELGEADHFNVEYGATSGGDTCNLWVSKEESFQWPDFNDLPCRPSDDEARTFLEGIVRAPPKGPISYYGGGGRSPLEKLLHPGDTLTRCKQLESANSTFFHIGEARSSTAFHCEDADFFSCNITDIGYKIWLVVRLDHTAKFEQYIRANWPCGDCAQFVRHLALLIPPSTLQREGIEFDIHCAGPGEMIITRPRQYHAVVNFSSCIARSINFVLAGQPLVPEGLAVCDQDGLYGLHKTYSIKVVPSRARLKRKAPLPRAEKNPRVKFPRIGEPEDSPSVAAIQRDLLALDSSIQFPQSCPSNRAVLRLAAPILGQFSASQLTSLRRTQQQELTEESVVRNDASFYDILVSQVISLRGAVATTHFYKVKVRIIQYSIARHIDDSNRQRDRCRTSIAQLDEVADKLWPQKEREQGRKTLRLYLEHGRKWAKLCGPLIGLLPLIPLTSANIFRVTKQEYWALEGTAISDFRGMFEGECGNRLLEGAEFAYQIMAPTRREE